MLCGQGKRGRPAPIVADHEQALLVQHVVHQAPDVLRDRLLVVAVRWPRRVAEAAKVGRDDAVARGQPRNDVPPHVPGLRPAMQQDDGRSPTRRNVVQPNLADIGVCVLERIGHRDLSG